MSWTCPSCDTTWPEKPLVDGTIGCPSCGNATAVAEVAITGGSVLVDESDLELIAPYKWRVHCCGGPLYATATLIVPGETIRRRRYRTLLMHRLIAGVQGGQKVDHVNGNGLDNRRFNLRVATHAQNMQNKRPANASGYKGVRRRGQRWVAQIASAHLGTFDTPEEAAAAYDRAARERWGTFARLNLPASVALEKVN